MSKSSMRRVVGVLGVVVVTQLLSACIVLPVPHRGRAVVVQPGYGHGHAPPPPYDYRDPRWRR